MQTLKNTVISLTIEDISNDGSGVGRYEGKAIFVPETAVGDAAQVRILKDMGRYAFGRLEKLISAGEGHIKSDCPVHRQCGGCCFRHLDYRAEAVAKEKFVLDAFTRLGKFDLSVLPIITCSTQDRYRNKVQFPVGLDRDGHVIAGFYAGRSHRIIPCEDCKLQPDVLNRIAEWVCHFLEKHSIPVYNEERHKGLVRHIFLRKGWHSGEILVCLVINGKQLPCSDSFCSELKAEFPAVKTVILNVNQKDTNVITGLENIVLYGPGYIRDTLCNVPVQLGPLSFYQVNTPAAERLYGIAREFAQLRPTDTLLDLYCGMGTIGLSMVEDCQNLVGVEIIQEAIDSARQNAEAMGAENTRFLCADAGKAASQLAEEGLLPQVICLDPPRKGCDETTLNAVIQMAPRTIVMVSCNVTTAARDCRYLCDHGYNLCKVQPVDLFPRTKHVEAVILLTRDGIDSRK